MVRNSILFSECTAEMQKHNIDSAFFDTKEIFQSVTHNRNIFVSDTVSDEQAEKIRIAVKKRCSGYPLQYIIGEWDFYGYTFRVSEDVLIPRPDTETLIENVIALCRENNIQNPEILDICSGSGCIAVTLKKEIPDSAIHAVEISEKAVELIRYNADLNNVKINMECADACEEITAEKYRNYDIIVSNPPYLTDEDMHELQKEVRYEPKLALFGGNDGLDFYRKLTPLWKNSLKNNGWLCYEFGMGQHEAVKKILEENNFSNITLNRDTQNIIRTVTAQKTEE